MTSFYTSVDRYGNNILFRGIEDGKRTARRVSFMPTLFVPSKKETGWVNLHNSPVMPMSFDSMRDASNFMKKYEGVDNYPICGTTNYVTQYINEIYPNEIKYDRAKINVTTIDIEVASDDGFPFVAQAAHPVISIAMKSNIDNIYRVWGLGDYDPDKCDVDGVESINYIKCKNEIDLLLSWLALWHDSRWCPDIVTGWNTRLFDFPYLINRVKNIIGGEVYKKFSPWGVVDQRNIIIAGRENIAYEIMGIQQLDYYDLFKKFGYAYGTLESYKLDHVAYIVLGDNKLSYEEHGNLHTLYKHDFQKFIDYNIKDVQLVDRFEEKMGLITLAITMAYRGGVNFSETFGTTGIWDSILYRSLYKQQIAVPPKVHKVKTPYPGAYVKDPQVGMHNWVVSFDLDALYPKTIVQYNMSPETVTTRIDNINVDYFLAGNSVEHNSNTVSATGWQFDKSRRGVIPEIIERYYAERKQIKKKMLSIKQQIEDIDHKLQKLDEKLKDI